MSKALARFLPGLVLLTATSVTPGAAQDQSPLLRSTVDRQQTCPYELCSLRVRRNAVVRGFLAEPVGRLGPFGGDVDYLLQGGPDVAINVERYQHAARIGTLAALAGVPLIALGPLAVANGPADYGNAQVATFAAGWTLGLYLLNRSIVGQRSARHALQRALWAYNRPFAPDGMDPPALRPIEPTRDRSAWLILGGGGLGALAGAPRRRSERLLLGQPGRRRRRRPAIRCDDSLVAASFSRFRRRLP